MLRKTLFIIALLMMALVGCTVVTTTEEFTLSIELNPGVDTVEVNSVFEDAGATAYLNGNAYDQVVVSQSSLDITRVGSYSIVYQTNRTNKPPAIGDRWCRLHRFHSIVFSLSR